MWSPGPHDGLGGTNFENGETDGGGTGPTLSSWARLGGPFGLNFWDPFLNFLGTFFSKTGHFRLFACPFWTSKNRFF